MRVKEKATAPVSSVGADGKQPLCNKHKEIIADLPTQGNLQATNNRGSGAEVPAEKKDTIDWVRYRKYRHYRHDRHG